MLPPSQSVRLPVQQALVQWSQKHAHVLTTPWADARDSAGAKPASLPDQAEALHGMERPEAGEQYWGTLQRLAALGWMEDAVGLLGLHTAWQQAYSGARNPQMLSLVGSLLWLPFARIMRQCLDAGGCSCPLKRLLVPAPSCRCSSGREAHRSCNLDDGWQACCRNRWEASRARRYLLQEMGVFRP